MTRLGEFLRAMAVYFGVIEELDDDLDRRPERSRSLMAARTVAVAVAVLLVCALLVKLVS
jgi:hypothetical protein